MFIFQGEIEMQKKTEYPETALQRVVSLWRCVQFCVPGIMLEGSYNNLQQHDWSWCDDDGDDDDDDDDDLWFMAINIDISKLMLYDFLCPSFAELPPQTPAHPPKTFHVHLTFVCRLCFSANRQGHWMPGHIQTRKTGENPSHSAWATSLIGVDKGMVGMVFKSCGKVKCQQP